MGREEVCRLCVFSEISVTRNAQVLLVHPGPSRAWPPPSHSVKRNEMTPPLPPPSESQGLTDSLLTGYGASFPLCSQERWRPGLVLLGRRLEAPGCTQNPD